MTSPPAVIDDIVVVGSSIDDNSRVDMPSGVVRAFDARTGALRWSWEPIPPNADSAGKKLADRGRQCVVHHGGGSRRAIWFLFPPAAPAPIIMAACGPATTSGPTRLWRCARQSGEVAWGFQLVHHDLWDYDSASPPLLATLKRNGRDIPVVVQGNKTGLSLRAQSRHGRAGVSRRGAPRAAERRAGRNDLAHAAVSGGAAAACAAKDFRRCRVGRQRRRTRSVPANASRR